MKHTTNSFMSKKLDSAFKVKKHIPYNLLQIVIKSKKIERNIYTLTVDYSSPFPLAVLKKALIMHADKINDFMNDINSNSYVDLQTTKEIENFKINFIENILYFFNEEDLIELFSAIEIMNFNTKFETVLSQVSGTVLQTSKKLTTVYFDKTDCLKLTDDLRSFFDFIFLEKHRYTIYGVYEHSQKWDKKKIQLFYDKEIVSKQLIDEILTKETKSYFQKGYNHHYWGVVSYKVVKEIWQERMNGKSKLILKRGITK